MVEETVLVELERIMPELRRWAKKFATPDYDQEEIVSDTIVRFLERPDKYKPESGTLRNYLFTVARNKALDQFKKNNRKHRQLFREHLRYRAPRSDRRTPAVLVGIVEFRSFVESEIEKLPPAVRDAFRMFAVEGLDYPTISDRLAVSRDNVKMLIYRARLWIRESVSGYLSS